MLLIDVTVGRGPMRLLLETFLRRRERGRPWLILLLARTFWVYWNEALERLLYSYLDALLA